MDPITRQGTADPRPVLLCGYYGEHNLGDDALLEALLSQLPAGVTPLVTAHDQPQVQARFGVDTVPRRQLRAVLTALQRCRALVLGGGSLLQDSTSFRSLLYYGALIAAARLQGKPVLLWAQGLGPLQRRRSRVLVAGLLRACTGITWRDPASAALSQRLGVASVHAADAVWGLPHHPWLGQGGPIVVCWRPTPLLIGEAWRPYLQALEQLAESANREVLWLPFHRDQDRGLLERLHATGLVGDGLMRRSRELEVLEPREASDVFRTAGLVLAMRLHALILAGLAGAPLAAQSYDPKVRAAAASIGCACCDLAEPTPSVAALLDTWRQALDRPADGTAITRLQDSTQLHRNLLAQHLG